MDQPNMKMYFFFVKGNSLQSSEISIWPGFSQSILQSEKSVELEKWYEI